MFDRSCLTKELENTIKKIKFVVFDFDGVFTDNMVYVFEDGRESVRCWRGDGIGIRKLERLEIEVIVLSTEVNPVVKYRGKKLGIHIENGIKNKLARLEELLEERGLQMDQTAFVGNDINDLECLKKVGLPIAVRDSHPDILNFSFYRTITPGGHGAVREVCDLFEYVLTKKG